MADLPLYSLHYEELTLVGTSSSRPRDMHSAIELAATGAVELEPLVSDRLPLDEAAEGLARLAGGALKVVLEH